MPYAGTSPYPTSPPAPVRKRPSAWWFGLGGVLVLAAVIVFGVSVARFVQTISHTDARFPDDGRHAVVLPAHAKRALFVFGDFAHPSCTAVDGNGSRIRFQRVRDDEYTYDGWHAVATFDTGDGHLTFHCQSFEAIADVRIGAVPDRHDVLALGLWGIAVPLLLGGAGFVVVLVTAILWFTRRPPRPGPPAYPPGYPPGYPAYPAPAPTAPPAGPVTGRPAGPPAGPPPQP
jgi:hypothetical protein